MSKPRLDNLESPTGCFCLDYLELSPTLEHDIPCVVEPISTVTDVGMTPEKKS